MKYALSEPLKDVRGKLIVGPNLDILEWVKNAPFSGEYLRSKAKLKDQGWLVEDFQSLLELNPYKNLFAGWVTDLREWIGENYAPALCLEELKLQKMRDPYAYKHTLIVALVGSRLMELWIKAPPTVRRTFLAFLFHDIGKTRIAGSILAKPGTLVEKEQRAVFEHPLLSYALNAAYWGDANHLCADVALHHCENRIGTGYPQQIKTNSLILDILQTVDRFDALITERPFRFKKFSIREALDLLRSDAEEGKFEPDVLRAMVALIRKEKVKDLKKIKLGTIGRPDKVTS